MFPPFQSAEIAVAQKSCSANGPVSYVGIGAGFEHYPMGTEIGVAVGVAVGVAGVVGVGVGVGDGVGVGVGVGVDEGVPGEGNLTVIMKSPALCMWGHYFSMWQRLPASCPLPARCYPSTAYAGDSNLSR